MSVKNFLKPIDMVSVNSNIFDGTYKTLTANLSQACSYLEIVNDSNQDITVSFDGGTTGHFFIPNNTKFSLYAQASAMPNTSIGVIARGTAISVNGAAAGVGLVYLSGLYQPNTH